MPSWKLLVVLAGLAIVTVGAVVLWPWPDPVTIENYLRIQWPGMTFHEVEAILGPPGDYRTGLGEDWQFGSPSTVPEPQGFGGPLTGWRATQLPNSGPERYAEWVGDALRIQVVVDNNGYVSGYAFTRRRPTQGLRERLIWRVQRRWRRWFP